MSIILRLLLIIALTPWTDAQELKPEHVAVVYNSASPHGRELAMEYMRLRNIPADNLTAINCSDKETISRSEFKRTILEPLRRAAREKNWWVISGNQDKPFLQRRIYAIVLISGVPLKIAYEPSTPGRKETQANTNAASVESELALMTFDGAPLDGMLRNPYYNKEQSIVGSSLPVVLLARLDALSAATVKRAMRDAVEVEKTGLWGWSVIDRGGPHRQGDEWLEVAAKLSIDNGFPLYLDRWGQTIAPHYPLMEDVAVYFGWYAWNINGPFLDPSFRFRPGAVAVHIHSFSASTLRKANTGWSGPLLERGAAATLGNVYEPFLTGSHHLDIFFDRLLKGYTLVEAAAMSIPVLSWQSTVIGDPLYRPFAARRDDRLIKNDRDRYFQAWWQATREWQNQPTVRHAKLDDAANGAAMDSFFREALAYQAVREGNKEQAKNYLQLAARRYRNDRDKLRSEMESANLHRNGTNDDPGFRALLDGLERKYPHTPYLKAIADWKKRATPPPGR